MVFLATSLNNKVFQDWLINVRLSKKSTILPKSFGYVFSVKVYKVESTSFLSAGNLSK